MIPFERQEALLSLLEEKKVLSVRELAKRLYISEASVRRDIAHLEHRALVKRIYGGVMLAATPNQIVPLDLRDGIHSAAKEAVARDAASRIRDGDTVILDGSSTVRRIIKYLEGKKDLKIITNNLRIFEECSAPGVTLYCTGGIYRPENHIFVGPAAESYLRTIHADRLFFSSQGISKTGEISDVSEEETALRQVMLTRATETFFLCDDSKFGITKTFTLCNRRELTEVLCNRELSWEEEG